tara:strand:- start:807 stop:1019 length:213 start_codon:yes stop_codon:yes gene_type:complete
MPESEDLTRYTAPPDNPATEPTYLLSQIIRYVETWSPHPYHHDYSLEEVRDLLIEAADHLSDQDLGIHTV